MGEYQALYRKWRPVVFGDVIGQEHVSETLKNEITNNRIAHAYLFCGTRGTGKTSTAKIFSRAINCVNPSGGDPCNECDTCKGILNGSIMDVYEMDAASNNGVDNIREIREEVAYTPSYGRYKVYIIDEVHMLSGGAFNALLKTLEEPPAHVVFILATTEPHKIPATILSRCQRFDFRRIRMMDVARRLTKIAEAEGIDITPDAVELVAEIADGSMRDGLSVLDQCVGYGRDKLTMNDVTEIVGIVDKSSLFDIVQCISEKDMRGALTIVDRLMDMGKEVLSLFEDLVTHYRNMLICGASDDDGTLIDKTQEIAEKYKNQSREYTQAGIMHCITVFNEYVLSAKWMSQPRVALEMAIVKAANPDYSSGEETLLARIEMLEKRLEGISSGGGTIVHEKSVAPAASKKSAAMAGAAVPESSAFAVSKPTAKDGEWEYWRAALNVIQEESKQLFAFLYPAKVYGGGGEVFIELSNSVAYDRVAKPEGIKYLEGLFSRVSSVTCSVSVEMKGSSKKTEKKADGMEEIAKMKDLFGDVMEIV